MKKLLCGFPLDIVFQKISTYLEDYVAFVFGLRSHKQGTQNGQNGLELLKSFEKQHLVFLFQKYGKF